jgi:mannosyl-3-phosphoglycerate phosphatase
MNRPPTTRAKGRDTRAIVIFTDLDGTLLDGETYSFDPANEALGELRARSIPIVLVSSKTRAEIEPLRSRLRNEHPFIVENGGAVLIPAGYFPSSITESRISEPYLVIELGTPYAQLRRALQAIACDIGMPLRGYGDMSVEEVGRRTGLSCEDAALSKQRDYDEPFVVEGQGLTDHALAKAVTDHGLRWTRGDRFHHLMGAQDKGEAVRRLVHLFQRKAQDNRRTLMTVALGNSLNDLPMLAVVDKPILVQLADGSYAAGIDLPRLIRAPAPGPSGWNQAILSLLP